MKSGDALFVSILLVAAIALTSVPVCQREGVQALTSFAGFDLSQLVAMSHSFAVSIQFASHLMQNCAGSLGKPCTGKKIRQCCGLVSCRPATLKQAQIFPCIDVDLNRGAPASQEYLSTRR
jgi:hypothetical protein